MSTDLTRCLIPCDASDVKPSLTWTPKVVFESFRLKPDVSRSNGENSWRSAAGETALMVLMVCQTCRRYKKRWITLQPEIAAQKRGVQTVVWFSIIRKNICWNNQARCLFWVTWEDGRCWFQAQETSIGFEWRCVPDPTVDLDWNPDCSKIPRAYFEAKSVLTSLCFSTSRVSLSTRCVTKMTSMTSVKCAALLVKATNCWPKGLALVVLSVIWNKNEH